MVIGFSISAAVYTAGAVYLGATTGTSYAYGRKVGRIVCERLDEFEGRMISYFAVKNAE